MTTDYLARKDELMLRALHDPLVGRAHVTQDFGNVRGSHYPNTYPWFGKHQGIDLAMRDRPTAGTPIHAPDDGVVLTVYRNVDYRGYAIEIQTPDGVWDFFHLRAEPSLRTGQRVTMGMVIGQIGATGDATRLDDRGKRHPAYHLHMGLREPGESGHYRDPLRAFGERLCEANDVAWEVYERQIAMESGWRSLEYSPSLKSSAGALGIAQIIPKWHPDAGDPWNPFTALTYSVELMRAHLDRANGDYAQALAAYNAGWAVAVESQDQWPDETQRYVAYILQNTPDESPTHAQRFANLAHWWGVHLRALPPDQRDIPLALSNGTTLPAQVIYDQIVNQQQVVQ